jgi:rhamnosyltransferase
MQSNNIAILLSTYNGENYISEQINSIINQTNSNWTLYIRDDGSSDGTLDIITRFVTDYENIVLLDSSINIGTLESFIWLMQNVNSSYYMFCDQDDIWLPNKIDISFSELFSGKDFKRVSSRM